MASIGTCHRPCKRAVINTVKSGLTPPPQSQNQGCRCQVSSERADPTEFDLTAVPMLADSGREVPVHPHASAYLGGGGGVVMLIYRDVLSGELHSACFHLQG